MFRMWCKLFDDRGHLIKDTVIKNGDSDLNRTRKIFFYGVLTILPAFLLHPLPNQSGLIPMFQNSSATRKCASLKITLLKISNLLIWKLRLLRKIRTGGLITALPLYLVLTLTFFPENAIPNFRISLIPSCFISESYLILSI